MKIFFVFYFCNLAFGGHCNSTSKVSEVRNMIERMRMAVDQVMKIHDDQVVEVDESQRFLYDLTKEENKEFSDTTSVSSFQEGTNRCLITLDTINIPDECLRKKVADVRRQFSQFVDFVGQCIAKLDLLFKEMERLESIILEEAIMICNVRKTVLEERLKKCKDEESAVKIKKIDDFMLARWDWIKSLFFNDRVVCFNRLVYQCQCLKQYLSYNNNCDFSNLLGMQSDLLEYLTTAAMVKDYDEKFSRMKECISREFQKMFELIQSEMKLVSVNSIASYEVVGDLTNVEFKRLNIDLTNVEFKKCLETFFVSIKQFVTNSSVTFSCIDIRSFAMTQIRSVRDEQLKKLHAEQKTIFENNKKLMRTRMEEALKGGYTLLFSRIADFFANREDNRYFVQQVLKEKDLFKLELMLLITHCLDYKLYPLLVKSFKDLYHDLMFKLYLHFSNGYMQGLSSENKLKMLHSNEFKRWCREEMKRKKFALQFATAEKALKELVEARDEIRS